MDIKNYFETEFAEISTVVNQTGASLAAPFTQWVEICTTAIKNGNKLILCGNGGSAADAQHLATELTVRFKKDRPPIAALALTTDTSALTAIGNDMGFENIFSRQLEALGKKGDVLIAISTSGNSTNIINVLHMAKKMGITATGLTGNAGGKMVGLADPLLIVPSTTTARIQEMHIALGQMLCGALEQKLNLV